MRYWYLGILMVISLVSFSLRPKQPLTVVVMIDGFPVRYLEDYYTPNLNGLAGAGVQAEAIQSVFPVKTVPNQYTIVTGLYPDHHGAISNVMQHGDRRFHMNQDGEATDSFWWGGEPIWITASKQGKSSFTYSWQGTEVKGMHPSKWYPYNPHITERERTDQVIQWINQPYIIRPNLITLYFDVIDRSGHDYGPDSKQVELAVESTDEQIGRLLEALEGIDANVIIMSDHGLVAVDPEKSIFLDDYVNPEDLDIIELSPYLMANTDSAEIAYAALKDVHPALSVYLKPNFPTEWKWGRHARTPQLVATLKTGWSLYKSRAHKANGYNAAGTHGYDDVSESHEGLFIASGPAFKQGITFPKFSNIHVYELLAHLMQIEPAPNDGDFNAVSGMLKDEYAISLPESL